MAFVPALIPLGVSLARISRNYNDDGSDYKIQHTARGHAIIDKLTKGGPSAPITQWSEAKLEKTIRRNSLFRDYANELRIARVGGVLSDLTSKEKEVAQATRSIAPVSEEVDGGNVEGKGEGGNDSDTLGEADLLLLAAEAEVKKAKNEPNVRDVALEVLADNSFDAILITDAVGVIAYSNKAFSKLTGYDQADVIGKKPNLLQGEGTDMKVIARLKDSMKKGLGDYEGSAINYRKNGTPFIMHWRVVPVKVGGEVKAWVAIQREGSRIPIGDVSPPARFNLDGFQTAKN
jgi:PAS domain S-box-containing protein